MSFGIPETTWQAGFRRGFLWSQAMQLIYFTTDEYLAGGNQRNRSPVTRIFTEKK
jgi:hypothetical protein